MATYYCKPDGDDALNGLSEANAWRTIEHAHATMVAGDTLRIMDGTWTFYATLIISTSGNLGNVISYEAYSATPNVVFRGNGIGRLMICTADYVRFESIQFHGDATIYTAALVELELCDNVEVQSCEMTSTQGHGIMLQGPSNITIDDCEIHGETYYQDTGFSGDGILVYQSASNITITNCTIYHMSHQGIGLESVTTVLVDGCTIYHNESHCIGVGYAGAAGLTATGVTIQNCTNYHAGWWRWPTEDPADKAGVWMGAGAGNVLVRRCTFYENDGPGVCMMRLAYGPIRVYHCVLYRNLYGEAVNWGDVAMIYGPAGTTRYPNVYLRNNVVVHDKEDAANTLVRESGFQVVALDYDDCYDETGLENIEWLGTQYTSYAAWRVATGQEAHGISSDPLFVNPPDDFHLQAASPCIDAGVPLSTEPGWYGAGPDIGRYEYVTGGIPVVVVVMAMTTVVPVVTVVVVAT